MSFGVLRGIGAATQPDGSVAKPLPPQWVYAANFRTRERRGCRRYRRHHLCGQECHHCRGQTDL